MIFFYRVLFFAMLFGILSCNRSIKYEDAKKNLIDSFYLSGVNSVDPILNLQNYKDGYLTYNVSEAEIIFFAKNNGKNYTPRKRRSLLVNDFIKGFFQKSYDEFLFVGDNNIIYETDSDLNIKKNHYVNIKLPFIKTNYFLFSSLLNSFIFKGDTLYTNIETKSGGTDNINNLNKEPCDLVIKLNKNDTATIINQVLSKPKDLARYMLHFAYKRFIGNKIVYLFPYWDTLYTYDIATKVYDKHPINNKDYSKAAFFDYNKIGTSDYNRYKSQYLLSIFYYTNMIYNPNTNHIILFYFKPEEKSNKKENLTLEDRTLYALILSEDYKYIETVRFESKYHYFFSLCNAGIALPLSDNKLLLNEKKIKYHIYNL